MKEARRPTYIIDTSVVLKWFYRKKEADVQAALKLREDYQTRQVDIVTLELLVYELANVLRYKADLEEICIDRAIESLFEMRILQSTNQEIMKGAVEIARRLDISVYDSSYLSYAEYDHYPFITADHKLFEKVKEEFKVIFITDYNGQA